MTPEYVPICRMDQKLNSRFSECFGHTGIGSFDELIGGGFHPTSVNLIDQDQFQMYGFMLAKSYISAAIHDNQTVLVFSPSQKTRKSRFFRELPTIKEFQAQNILDGKVSPAKDTMKIAFRYSNLPSRFDEHLRTKKVDFSQHIDPIKLDEASIEFHQHSDLIPILKEKVHNSNNQKIRILIEELGSPLSELKTSRLVGILHQVRLLIRRMANAVCLVTLVPADYSEDIDPLETVREQLYFESDSVTKMVAFSEDENNPYAIDYQGLVRLMRLPRLNSLAPYNPLLETTEFGIKLSPDKRFLSVEPLALPPDLGETVNRFTSSSQAAETISKQIDF